MLKECLITFYTTAPVKNVRMETRIIPTVDLLRCPDYAATRTKMITSVSGLVPAAQTLFDNLNIDNENLLTGLLLNRTQKIFQEETTIFLNIFH